MIRVIVMSSVAQYLTGVGPDKVTVAPWIPRLVGSRRPRRRPAPDRAPRENLNGTSHLGGGFNAAFLRFKSGETDLHGEIRAEEV
jgi:hypothetical protein